MKREYIAMIFMVSAVALIFITGLIFGLEIVFAQISRYIVIWLLIAFYAGQYSMKFPKNIKMYVTEKNINLNEDPDTIIWKYLDLSKFVDLLLYKKLFMSRSDKFEDQYEGTFSEPTYEEIKKLAKDNPNFLDYYKTHRKNVVISSWHINEYESYAMWQIFTQKMKVWLFNLL